jgi:hypothetical protein
VKVATPATAATDSPLLQVRVALPGEPAPIASVTEDVSLPTATPEASSTATVGEVAKG